LPHVRPCLPGAFRIGSSRLRAFHLVAAICSLGQFAPLVVRAQAAAPSRRSAAREPLGFSQARLARIDRMLQRFVDENRIPGAVGLVLRNGQVAYEQAVGWSDKESGRRMTTDAIFRIASQTKAITSVAIMMLMEEGLVSISDTVSRYIPSFARTTVAVRADTGRAIIPAKRAITIRDLLTHTAGISYGTDSLVAPLYATAGLGPAAGRGWYTADKNEPICDTMERLGRLPFVAQPGEAFVYGYSTDILGCVVERVSGMKLDEFVRTRITAPLGMRDTYFFLPPEKRHRLTTVYASDVTGMVTKAPDGAHGQGDYVDGPRKSFSGGAGLVSTARDYSRFLQMLLNGGILDGVRILGPKTVELMTTNQVGTLFNANGLGFGLGFETVDRFGADDLASLGSFSWGGAYASTYLVDPKERLVIVYMMQLMPNRSELGGRFPTLVYQALVEPNAEWRK
jgi:CubicO group peptidase (beta-lactamase class C family)